MAKTSRESDAADEQSPSNRSNGNAADGVLSSDEGREKTGVATSDQNAALQHTEGGATTRDDKSDLGVPMLPGSPDEPQGPEDALGVGPKRGDYSKRLGLPGELAHEGSTPQAPRVENVGDEPGKKGGVDTAAQQGASAPAPTPDGTPRTPPSETTIADQQPKE